MLIYFQKLRIAKYKHFDFTFMNHDNGTIELI